MWFDPSDQTFPNELGDHLGVTALNEDGVVVGGALWAPAGKNLFLHQLIANKEGKELQMPTRLIWESLLSFNTRGYFAIEGFKSLDIGVSYNPKRYQFFKNFAVETYPIILKKPELVPVIRLTPFNGFYEKKPQKDLGDYKSINATFLPRGMYALEAALRVSGVGKDDVVTVVKTFGGAYVSGCVRQVIEKLGAVMVLDAYGSDTAACVVINEFGLPITQQRSLDILRAVRGKRVPIIEDCAWMPMGASHVEADYRVYSVPKLYPFNYGGILWGAHIDDETLWSWGMLDTVKRGRSRYEPDHYHDKAQRIANWSQYHNLVLGDGMTPDDRVDYIKAINDGWCPTVYMQRFRDSEEADAIIARLEEFGIQAGRYYPEPIVYLPVHQNMTSADVEYMFAVVRGYFNLCRDYGKR